MEKGHLFSFNLYSIVGRLQFASIVIALATFIQCVLVFKQMSQVRQAKEIVFDTESHALLAIEEANLNFTALLDLATAMAREDRRDQIEYLHRLQEKMRAKLAGRLDTSVEPKLRVVLQARLSEIGDELDEIHALSVEHLSLQQKIQALLDQLDAVELQVEQSTATAILELTFILSDFGRGGDVSQSEAAQRALELGTVSAFRTEMLRLFTLLDAAKQSGDRANLAEFENRIRQIVRNSTQSILAFRDKTFGASSALTIKKLEDLLLAEDGVFTLIRLRLGIERTRDAYASDIATNATDAMIEQSQMFGETSHRILEAGSNVETAIARTIMIDAISMIFVLFVVQRILRYQIADRMSRLKKTVQRIADGDFETPVDLAGRDEVASIARALEVFKRQAAELERSNEDLERFAYVASHDLRSPLKSIYNLASWVTEDAGPELSEENRQHLDLIMSRVTRLRQLSEDLLTYARINAEPGKAEMVDLPLLVSEVVDLVDTPPGFAVHTEILIEKARICVSPFRQILLNLIVNAIKHHDRDNGNVWVGVAANGDLLDLAVSDDGAGIAPEYHQQIFEPFKKLESRDKVEGSGMGLTIINRLVKAAGGTMEVISDPSRARGCEFVARLPCGDAQIISTRSAAGQMDIAS